MMIVLSPSSEERVLTNSPLEAFSSGHLAPWSIQFLRVVFSSELKVVGMGMRGSLAASVAKV